MEVVSFAGWKGESRVKWFVACFQSASANSIQIFCRQYRTKQQHNGGLQKLFGGEHSD
jgi:hypothetical protein